MHNIEHYTYPENIKRDWVQKELDSHAAYEDRYEGCTGLYRPIRWLESADICKDYNEAIDYIDTHDRKDYDQLAVRYYETDHGFTDKKFEELKAKERAARDAYLTKDAVWAKGLKAEFVGCKNCSSKIKREYIMTNSCPVCRAELRPESTLKTVESAKARWNKAIEAAKEYQYRHAKKIVKWLVKIEYHT